MMIQPIRTLRDHPNVFELPNQRQQEQRRGSNIIEEDDPPTNIMSAYDNVRRAIESRKIDNLDDFLLSPGAKPEIDQKMVDKNRKATKKMALLQAIDSIGNIAGKHVAGENAITTPARFDQVGMEALNNIVNLEQEHKLDLRRFDQKKDNVDRFNKQLGMQVDGLNSQVDLELAQGDFNQLLNKETAEALKADQEKERYYEAGLRSISRGDTAGADFYLGRAGLGSGEISRIKKQSGTQITDGVNVDPKKRALYDEYQHYLDSVDDSQYMKDDRQNPDYSKPKPGTAAWHVDKLLNQMGEDFYLLDYAMRPERESVARASEEAEERGKMDEYLQSPEIRELTRGARQTNQVQIMHNFFTEAKDFQSQQDMAALWLQNNREMLLEDGVSEDEVDDLNEEMFVEILERERSKRSGVEQTGAESQVTPTESQGKPNRRDNLPRHLQQSYDLGNKLLEQRHRIRSLRERNPDADLSFAEREEKRLVDQLRERYNRLPREEDRQALLQALELNPEDLE